MHALDDRCGDAACRASKRGFDAIQVYVDRLTKLKRFAAARTTDGSVQLAGTTLRTIIGPHGMPKSMVSDRDPRITARFWRELSRVLGSEVNLSTAHHPQSDGQSEREIQTLITALRSYVNAMGNDWDEYLPALELAFNSKQQASTGAAPFTLVYGTEARLPIDCALDDARPADGAGSGRSAPSACRQALDHARSKAELAQAKQKRLADRHRRLLQLKEGDQVLLATEGLQLRSGTHKLTGRYIGPFRVLGTVNDNAVTLELPPLLGALHPTFNISRLKLYRDGSARVRESTLLSPGVREHVSAVCAFGGDAHTLEGTRRVSTRRRAVHARAGVRACSAWKSKGSPSAGTHTHSRVRGVAAAEGSERARAKAERERKRSENESGAKRKQTKEERKQKGGNGKGSAEAHCCILPPLRCGSVRRAAASWTWKCRSSGAAWMWLWKWSWMGKCDLRVVEWTSETELSIPTQVRCGVRTTDALRPCVSPQCVSRRCSPQRACGVSRTPRRAPQDVRERSRADRCSRRGASAGRAVTFHPAAAALQVHPHGAQHHDRGCGAMCAGVVGCGCVQESIFIAGRHGSSSRHLCPT